MQEMPHDVFALFVLAFVFGIKHGLDPDHLATIDGLARFNATAKPWLAKWVGVIFSVGHGVVVTMAVGIVAFMPTHITLPSWLEGLGMAVSIITLLLLGGLNIYAAFKNKAEVSRPIGLKSWMYFHSARPEIVLGIGALFALSFDTMSLAVFFSLAASHVSIAMYASALGIVFTCGMIVSDGINGVFTTRFIRQAGDRGFIASRVMSFAIGSLSLLIAILGISRLFLPGISEHIEHLGIWTGMFAMLWVAAAFVASVYFSRSSKLLKQNF